MMKTTYATMLLVIGLMALIFMLPSVYLNAEPIGNPASPVSIINQTDIKGLNQSESPLLMAQATEEHRSSESSSSSSMKTTTTEAPQAVVEHNCAGHCRDRYTESLGECNDPGHPHHRSCEKWARERESECLDKCSRE